jgi:hypothetical protein
MSIAAYTHAPDTHIGAGAYWCSVVALVQVDAGIGPQVAPPTHAPEGWKWQVASHSIACVPQTEHVCVDVAPTAHGPSPVQPPVFIQ